MCGGCPTGEGDDERMQHDPCCARWTGIWPGLAECRELGLFCKWTSKGWEVCDESDPEARPDLNTFLDKGYHKIFFIKPTKENGRML